MDKNKRNKSGRIALILVSLMMIGLFSFGIYNVIATDDIKDVDDKPSIVTNPTTEKLLDDDYQDSLRDTDVVKKLIDDKYKSYDVSEKEILIESLKDETIIEMKLISEYEERVSSGIDKKVANILISDWGIKDLDLSENIKGYDINNKYKLLDKEFKLKYKTVTVEKRCYEVYNNKTLKNETQCYDYDIIVWTEFELLSGLPEKGVEIGLFTDTILDEEIEWVITLDDIQILEWASYLVTDLVSYYKFDESSGTVLIDSLNARNGTNSGFLLGATGIIDKAYDYHAAADYISFGTTPDSAMTWNIWVYYTTSIQFFENLISERGGRAHYLSYRSYTDATGVSRPLWNIGGVKIVHTSDIGTGGWHMLTGTWDGTTDANSMRLYVDGVNSVNGTAGSSGGSTAGTYIGQNPYIGNGAGDVLRTEFGYWDTALSADAITDLFNSGDGKTYPFENFCEFSGYVFDESSTELVGANVTIWNQYDITEYYENTTNSNGYWSYNIANGTETYMIGAVYNDTIIGQLKPYVSGTC